MEKQEKKTQIVRNLAISAISKEFDDKKICELMADGYEIVDIIPYLTRSQWGASIRPDGVYVENVLVVLEYSGIKSKFFARKIKKDRDYEENINKTVEDAFQDGARLIKIIPINGHLTPEIGRGSGAGTYFFVLFFVKEI